MVKAKKEIAKKRIPHTLYLGIVAIVAVVAIVILVLNYVKAPAQVVTEDGEAVVGEAIRYALPTAPTAPANVIKKGDVFILPVNDAIPNGVHTNGEIIEYMGADKATDVYPKIQFKIWNSGEIIEYSIPAVNNEQKVIIKLGGQSFRVNLLNSKAVDSPLQIDFNGDGTVDTAHEADILHYKLGATSAYRPVVELACGVEIKNGDTFALDAFEKGVFNLKFLGTNYNQHPQKASFKNLPIQTDD
ncbi:MAG: hypothetical protein AB1668_02040 [Nanoarchaeota archaeon]